MLNKIIFYILFLLINSSLEDYTYELPQYGSLPFTCLHVLYLSLDNFKSKDTLYFKVSFHSTNNHTSTFLGFLEKDNNNYPNFEKFYYVRPKLNYIYGDSYTFYFSYTLKGNKKYLLIKVSDLHGDLLTMITLEHIKELPHKEEQQYKENDIVGGIICIVVDVIIFIALNIILCRCKRKQEESLRQLIESHNTNQPTYTNQPVFTQPQPLSDQSQTPVY